MPHRCSLKCGFLGSHLLLLALGSTHHCRIIWNDCCFRVPREFWCAASRRCAHHTASRQGVLTLTATNTRHSEQHTSVVAEATSVTLVLVWARC